MAGPVFLGHGPFGIAVTTPRAVRKPGGAKDMRVLDSAATRLDREPFPNAPLPHRQSENAQSGQQAIDGVAPATLFETSLIATGMLAPDAPSLDPAGASREPWLPPQSSLTLRDRKI